MSRRQFYMTHAQSWAAHPRTVAVRRAMDAMHDDAATDDLLFLEDFETRGVPSVAAALRASQIRRANPLLAAELRAELKRGRPLTPAERGVLVAMIG